MFKKIISFFHNFFFYRRTKIKFKDLKNLVDSTLFLENNSLPDLSYFDYISRSFNGK